MISSPRSRNTFDSPNLGGSNYEICRHRDFDPLCGCLMACSRILPMHLLVVQMPMKGPIHRYCESLSHLMGSSCMSDSPTQHERNVSRRKSKQSNSSSSKTSRVGFLELTLVKHSKFEWDPESQRSMQPTWNEWLHGSTLRRSPSTKWSMQITQKLPCWRVLQCALSSVTITKLQLSCVSWALDSAEARHL